MPKNRCEEKTVKVKDPRRVASGKRLAELSRQAREHKKFEKQHHEQEAEQSGFIPFLPFCAIPLAFFGVGGYLYSKSKDEKKAKEPKLLWQNQHHYLLRRVAKE